MGFNLSFRGEKKNFLLRLNFPQEKKNRTYTNVSTQINGINNNKTIHQTIIVKPIRQSGTSEYKACISKCPRPCRVQGREDVCTQRNQHLYWGSELNCLRIFYHIQSSQRPRDTVASLSSSWELSLNYPETGQKKPEILPSARRRGCISLQVSPGLSTERPAFPSSRRTTRRL